MLARDCPQAEVHGLDGDAAVLAMAANKTRQGGIDITWTRGLSFDLPYPDQCFHRVTASLMLHHLNRDQKQRTISEVWRVLRPNGESHIVDFDPPHSLFTAAICLVIRQLEEIADNVDRLLLTLLNKSGFAEVRESGHWTTVLGLLTFLKALKTDVVA